ncbi:hypothetical protein PtrSN002B_005209 [Pyrenophora tritici-repentis]|nr:hypothetical protein PtrV1_01353 [Pyrenophora tritici-repentis]KAF7454090.1 hypothetical protein A1F99_013480 [Pyrenophora tritici-repentis]KAF7577179.1 hypothetical protein PtrM4_014190 [Pyrenophora tritici-repentis]KAG9387836.1 hypothetical protein A1F94_000728 [Pyrenophora tritici-repentis]KAI0578295.1 hypothetical protein Alg215_06427 [Pyrenophora tritici-repentis]
MMLMNSGPVSFMKLYENWSEDDKKVSRLGRAVWATVRAVASSKDEQVEPHSENELEDAEDNRSEDTISDAGTDDSFIARKVSIDISALARGNRGGAGNIIFMGNQVSKPIAIGRSQLSQIRQAPDGSFMLGNDRSRGAMRVKMLPPRVTKQFRTIAPTDTVPEPECTV